MDRYSEENPYRPADPAEPEPLPQPGVITWFYVYCVVMFVLYLVLVIVGTVLLFVDPDDLDMEPLEARIGGVVYLALGLIFMIPFAVAPFLPTRNWSWIVCLVLICLGMTSPCCLPATIPLLIFWIKQETRDYFAAGGMAAGAAS